MGARALAGLLVTLCIAGLRPLGQAAEPTDAPPDAEVLLNLDLLKDADLARERDLLHRLPLFGRLRLLESLGALQSGPSVPESEPSLQKGKRRPQGEKEPR